MKTKTNITRRVVRLTFALALLSTLNPQLSTCLAQGTAFTYQGRLTDGTNVANGNYDLTFSVWDSASGPTQIGSTNRPVAVSNGLFTVALDFGSGIFTGSARWLEIGVRTNGSAEDYTPLNPRQPLSAAPYAVMAGTAGALPSGSISNSQIASGQVVKSLNGLKDNVVLDKGVNVTLVTNGNVLTINSSGSGAFSLNGTNAYYTAGYVGIGTTNPGARLDVRGLGQFDNQVLSLGNLTGNPNERVSLFYDGNVSRAKLIGVSGVGLSFGTGGGADKMIIDTGGNVGIGTTSPQAKLQVNTDEEGIRLRGNASSFFSKALMTFYSAPSTFPPFPSTRMGYVGDASADDYDIYLNADVGNVHLSTSAGTVLTAGSSGNVGIGTATPAAPLDVVRYQGYVRLLSTNSSNGSVLELRNNTLGFGVSLGAINFAGFDGNVPGQIAFFEDGTMLFRATVVSVPVLQINGADVAEPFEMSTKNLPKGSVVIIDEENPGQLKPSDRAYDTRVAGILSGANGINSGIRLRQQGFNDHGENVALSGRVYAQADASFGAIKPGDLLTTSDTPGHSMKVTDHARAQGAIIGKAMSALQEGKGMVLVLVSLQ